MGRTYWLSMLSNINAVADALIDALPTATRARRRRLFRELHKLALEYDRVEAVLALY